MSKEELKSLQEYFDAIQCSLMPLLIVEYPEYSTETPKDWKKECSFCLFPIIWLQDNWWWINKDKAQHKKCFKKLIFRKCENI